MTVFMAGVPTAATFLAKLKSNEPPIKSPRKTASSVNPRSPCS